MLAHWYTLLFGRGPAPAPSGALEVWRASSPIARVVLSDSAITRVVLADSAITMHVAAVSAIDMETP